MCAPGALPQGTMVSYRTRLEHPWPTSDARDEGTLLYPQLESTRAQILPRGASLDPNGAQVALFSGSVNSLAKNQGTIGINVQRSGRPEFEAA